MLRIWRADVDNYADLTYRWTPAGHDVVNDSQKPNGVCYLIAEALRSANADVLIDLSFKFMLV